MELVQAFKTSDGEVFFTESEALAHQSVIDNSADVQAFIDSDQNIYKSGAAASIASASVHAYKQWEAAGKPAAEVKEPEPEAAAAEPETEQQAEERASNGRFRSKKEAA